MRSGRVRRSTTCARKRSWTFSSPTRCNVRRSSSSPATASRRSTIPLRSTQLATQSSAAGDRTAGHPRSRRQTQSAPARRNRAARRRSTSPRFPRTPVGQPASRSARQSVRIADKRADRASAERGVGPQSNRSARAVGGRSQRVDAARHPARSRGPASSTPSCDDDEVTVCRGTPEHPQPGADRPGKVSARHGRHAEAYAVRGARWAT